MHDAAIGHSSAVPTREPAPPPNRRRRALLQAAVAGAAAAGGAGLLTGGKSALAADVVIGANNTSTGTTRLTSNTTSVTFDARNSAASGDGRTGLRGSVENISTNVAVATAVAAFAKNGTGVFSSSVNGKALDLAGRATVRADTSDGLTAPSMLIENRAASGTNRKGLVVFLTDNDAAIPDHPVPAAIFAELDTVTSKSEAIVGRAQGVSQTGVRGESSAGSGVVGATEEGVGVRALAGLGGIALAAVGGIIGAGEPSVPGSTVVDVSGTGGGNGLTARTTSGTGVVGAAGSGVGLRGVAEDTGGVGVRAESAFGVALDVLGTVAFSASATVVGEVAAASFAGDGAAVTGLDADNVATGVLSADRIPGLSASKLTSGTLSPARIPGLRAGKVVRGRLAEARLPRTAVLRTAKRTAFAGKVSAAQFSGLRGAPPVFARAQMVTVGAGQTSAFVRSRGLTDKHACLATLQADAGDGVGVLRTERVPGGVRVVLTRSAEQATAVGVFVFGAV